jgi:proteasome lid subunit RPN8/RPN11
MAARRVFVHDIVRAEMIAHARAAAPNECCGLLVGAGSLIDGCVRVRNVDPTPARRYRLDPAEHIAVNRRLRGTNRIVVGCYHSHPHSPPVPSAADCAEAYYPDFVWVIVSLHTDEGAIAAYRIVGNRFEDVMTLRAHEE